MLTFKRGKHVRVVYLSDQDASLPPHESVVLAGHPSRDGWLTLKIR